MTPAPRQPALLVALPLAWGLNRPATKLGVTHVAPPSFRALSRLLGLPLPAAALPWPKVPFRVPRAHRPELARPTLTNVIAWHLLVILAVPHLSSERAAIVGYTMPAFSALVGAALGIVLLLRREFARVAGASVAAGAMLAAAACRAPSAARLRWTTCCTGRTEQRR